MKILILFCLEFCPENGLSENTSDHDVGDRFNTASDQSPRELQGITSGRGGRAKRGKFGRSSSSSSSGHPAMAATEPARTFAVEDSNTSNTSSDRIGSANDVAHFESANLLFAQDSTLSYEDLCRKRDLLVEQIEAIQDMVAYSDEIKALLQSAKVQKLTQCVAHIASRDNSEHA